VSQTPNVQRRLTSTAHVIVRFGVRMIVLSAFAAFGSIGFGTSLTALLWMSTLLCAIAASVKRELPFYDDLNHWDEMVAYAALCCLIGGHTPAVPV
jgi:hypothetical protein